MREMRHRAGPLEEGAYAAPQERARRFSWRSLLPLAYVVVCAIALAAGWQLLNAAGGGDGTVVSGTPPPIRSRVGSSRIGEDPTHTDDDVVGFEDLSPEQWRPRPTPAAAAAAAAATAAAAGQYSGYTFWSNDFHISPIADLKDLFDQMNMRVIDKSLSGHCHLKKTCAQDLKVLNRDNGINLSPCPMAVRRQYFDAYKADAQFAEADAFVCHHPSSMCEVFMPFNRPMIVHASTRFEMGRHDPARWSQWIENLRTIARNPMNIVAANNLYDAEYIKYFTGLQEVVVIPNYCGYTGVSYAPSRPQVLVGPGHVDGKLLAELRATNDAKWAFEHVRSLYPHFQYADLAAHPAIVLLPYQVSVMSLFEYYRMNLPIFAPSVELLSQWHLDRGVISERTWDRVFGHPKHSSPVPRHSASDIPYDPNDEFSLDAIRYWIKFADFYQWPHITLFDSWPDLLAKLSAADLPAISQRMVEHNTAFKADLFAQWQGIFARMFGSRAPGQRAEPDTLGGTFEQAMNQLYGVASLPRC